MDMFFDHPMAPAGVVQGVGASCCRRFTIPLLSGMGEESASSLDLGSSVSAGQAQTVTDKPASRTRVRRQALPSRPDDPA
jgi:hypothetical protein